MKKNLFLIFLTALVAMLLVGCNDPAPTAMTEPEGTEKIETEMILTESIITWDNCPTQTWD